MPALRISAHLLREWVGGRPVFDRAESWKIAPVPRYLWPVAKKAPPVFLPIALSGERPGELCGAWSFSSRGIIGPHGPPTTLAYFLRLNALDVTAQIADPELFILSVRLVHFRQGRDPNRHLCRSL